MNTQSKPPSGSDDSPDAEWAELVREFAAPPPLPSESAWRDVRDGIVDRLQPSSIRHSHRRMVWTATTLAACLILGVTLWWSKPWAGDERTGAETPFDPLAEYEVLPIASSNDVMVSAVRGGIEFASIDHPLPGVMSLADGDEFTAVRPWTGELSQPAPADAPILVDK